MPSIGTRAKRSRNTSKGSGGISWASATHGTRLHKSAEAPPGDVATEHPENTINYEEMITTLLTKRVIIISLSCHREIQKLILKLKEDTRVPHFSSLSACSPNFFDVCKRSRQLAVLDMFNKQKGVKPSLCLSDLDALSAVNSKALCVELKEPRSPSDGIIIAVWPGIPQKCIAMLPIEYVVSSTNLHDIQASRLAARSILDERPPPRMQDHSELVPSCERSLVGLLIHGNMSLISGDKVTDAYLAALEYAIIADPADRLSHVSNQSLIVELSSMIRTIGVSQSLRTHSNISTPLPSTPLAFTKLLAAHATIRTRLGAVRDLCNHYQCTFRELGFLYGRNKVEPTEKTSVAVKRLKSMLL